MCRGLQCRMLERSQRILVLALPAGCFHFEEVMQHLAQHGHRVWAMDFVGQGRSWPRQPHGVAYSVDLWTDQVHWPRHELSSQSSDSLRQTFESVWVGKYAQGRARSASRHVPDPACNVQVKSFVDENIGEAVFVVGNSLGGFVAASFAALHPRLSRGVRLRLLWSVIPATAV